MKTSDTPIFWSVVHDLASLMTAPPRAITLDAEPLPGKVESAPLSVPGPPAARPPVKRTRKRGGAR